MNDDLAERLSKLSPKQRALLEARILQNQAGYSIPWAQRTGRIPLSFPQERLWLLSQLEPGSHHAASIAYRISGALDADALERSLARLVLRHETLRTTFLDDGGEPAQAVGSGSDFRLRKIALEPRPGQDRGEKIRTILEEEARRPFDLRTGPLFRAVLVIAEAECALLLGFHNIVFDGWSLGVLQRELGALYRALSAGEEPGLPPLALQYRDFAAWQRGSRRPEKEAEAHRYWAEHLRGVRPLWLPIRRHLVPKGLGEARLVLEESPASTRQRLERLGRECDSSLYMVLFAAFQTLLHRCTRQDDIAAWSSIADRGHPDLENLIGFFTHTLMMRTAFPSGMRFGEVLAEVRRNALAAYEHREIPFARLVEILGPTRHSGSTPPSHVMFVLHNSPIAPIDIPGLRWELEPLPARSMRFDLELQIWPQDGSLRMMWHYDRDLFSQEAIERMAGHYRALLEDIADRPDLPVAEYLPEIAGGETDRQSVPAEALDRSAPKAEYVAPRTEFERQLAEIWRKVMSLENPPGVFDDFFDLGGHSLLSARLIDEVEKTLRCRVPIRSFMARPTVAAMAELLGGSPDMPDRVDEDVGPSQAPDAKGRTSIFRLPSELENALLRFTAAWQGHRASPCSLVVGCNVEGKKPPLFWVFQGYQEFHALSHQLGPDQPVYGMRSTHLAMERTEDNIQALALAYASEIVSLRPEGPLLVGGNCQGGIVALALAQHLQRRKRWIPLLALLEWPLPPQPFPGPVALLFGFESHMNPYRNPCCPERDWKGCFPKHEVYIVPGAHGQFFQERNVQALAAVLSGAFARACAKEPAEPSFEPRDSLSSKGAKPKPDAESGGFRPSDALETFRRGDFAAALPQLEELAAATAAALPRLAECLLLQKCCGEAAVRFRQALAFQPDDPELWFGLGQAEAACGNDREAADALRQAHEKIREGSERVSWWRKIIAKIFPSFKNFRGDAFHQADDGTIRSG